MVRIARMGDHLLLFLEPLVDSIPADADEPLCKPLFVKPRAVTKQTATPVLSRANYRAEVTSHECSWVIPEHWPRRRFLPLDGRLVPLVQRRVAGHEGKHHAVVSHAVRLAMRPKRSFAMKARLLDRADRCVVVDRGLRRNSRKTELCQTPKRSEPQSLRGNTAAAHFGRD